MDGITMHVWFVNTVASSNPLFFLTCGNCNYCFENLFVSFALGIFFFCRKFFIECWSNVNAFKFDAILNQVGWLVCFVQLFIRFLLRLFIQCEPISKWWRIHVLSPFHFISLHFLFQNEFSFLSMHFISKRWIRSKSHI